MKRNYTNLLSSLGVLALVFLVSNPVRAIEIYGLFDGGEELLSTTWISHGGSGASVTDVSGGAETDWQVLVGLDDFGDAEGDSQTEGIYGGGAILSTGDDWTGFKVVFDVQAHTWDSYNSGVAPAGTPAPGSTGYWDAFAVNVNAEEGFYWDLVGDAGDPITSVDPAGTPVIDPEGTGPLAGATWAWGGLDYANGTFESHIGTYTLLLEELDNNTTVYVSAVLDTATSPDHDEAFPSWGCFNAPSTTNCPVPQVSVPEPSSLVLLGLGMFGLMLQRKRA